MSNLPSGFVPDIGLLAERAHLLEKKLELQEQLPHLYGWKWYPWAWEFFKATDRYTFLVAANQISKSSSQIRKCIEWAGNTDIWPALWRTRPRQFWYLYPSKDVALVEFESKWVPEFMPRDIDHPTYGWKFDKKRLALYFNSGVVVYFKSYMTDASNLQTASAHAIFCDEELPFNLFSEINMRIAGVAGYFSMVFTATLGQEEWRRTMEDVGKKTEMFTHAWKRCVSMYDCKLYNDGSKSHWTEQKIKEIEATLTPLEILRRVHGRFVVSEGLQYPTFQPQLYPDGNYYEETKWALPKDWLVYAGVDIGGGGSSHPPAITFLGVDPRFTKGRAFITWRGFPSTVYTVEDIYKQLRRMVDQYELNGTSFEVRYDWASKDFGTIAGRDGFPVFPAEKSRDSGKMALNSLFKSKALLCSDELSGPVLYEEIRSLTENVDKHVAKDDALDSLRYAVTSIPWAWDIIMRDATKEQPKAAAPVYKAKYRGDDGSGVEVLFDSVSDEIGELNGFSEF